MALDARKNFATSLVATAPSPAASGTSLVVTAGQGTRFPTPPFNAIIAPATTAADPSNAEVVRVTGIATDTLTITRAQEGSSARTVVVGDRIYVSLTKKTIDDIEVIDPRERVQILIPGTVGAPLYNYGFMSPATLSVARGTFVAEASTVIAESDISPTVFGTAKLGAVLYVGPTGTDPLHRSAQEGALPANVLEYPLSAHSPSQAFPFDPAIDWGTGANPSPARASVRVTGLTPGTTYAAEVAFGVVGALTSGQMGLSTSPDIPDVSEWPDEDNHRIWAVRNNGDNTVTVGLVGHSYAHPNDQALETYPVQTGPGRVAVSYKGRYVVVTNSASNSVTSIDLQTGVVSNIATGVAGANPVAVAAVKDPSQEGIFYVGGVNGRFWLFNAALATPAFGAQYTTGIPSNINHIAIAPWLTEAILTVTNSRVITKVNLSTTAASDHTYSGNSGGFTGAAYGAFGLTPHVWLVGTNGTNDNYLCSFNVTSNTFANAVGVGSVPVGPPAPMLDGRQLFYFSAQAASATGNIYKQVNEWTIADRSLNALTTPVEYLTWGTALTLGGLGSGGGCTDRWGGIFASALDQQLLLQWPGCRARIRTADGLGESGQVNIIGAR